MPDGWSVATLREIVTHQKGKRPKLVSASKDDGLIPYIDIRAFEHGEITSFADSHTSTIVAAEDVVVVWDGARSGLVGKTPKTGALGSTLVKLKPLAISSDYLYRYLQSCYETINANPRGTGIPHVEPELFWNLKVPIPPLPEQDRIVFRLDRLFSEIGAISNHLSRVPAILKRFCQTVEAAACSGRLTEDWRDTAMQQPPSDENRKVALKRHFDIDTDVETPTLPPSWKCIPIGSISSFQQGMQIAKKTRLKEGGKNRLPILRIGTYANGFTDDVDYVEVNDDTLIAEADDIILARTGETRGKVLTGYRGVFHNNTFRLNYDRNLVMRDYLICWLQTGFVQEYIRQHSGRSAQPDLTHKAFGPCPFALPPKEEQEEIVRRVKSILEMSDTVQQRTMTATLGCDKLAQSILAKAFRGELVPTEAELARREGREYEPASVLLERIKNERESSPDVKRKQKRKV